MAAKRKWDLRLSTSFDYIGKRRSGKCVAEPGQSRAAAGLPESDFGFDTAAVIQAAVSQKLSQQYSRQRRERLRDVAVATVFVCAIRPTTPLRRVRRNSIRTRDTPPTPAGAGFPDAPRRSENTRAAVSGDAPGVALSGWDRERSGGGG